jgi:uncharacterized protein (TIGR02300 family)
VAKPEWGAKRTCHSCGARFYDLRREPIVCPICGAVHDPERQPRPRRPGPALKEEPVLAAGLVDEEAAADGDVAESDAADSDLEELDDAAGGEDDLATESEELMEDTSELGEDDDDIGEVMEHVDDEIDDKP